MKKEKIERIMGNVNFTKLQNGKFVNDLKGETYLSTLLRLTHEKGASISDLSEYFHLPPEKVKELIS